MALYPVVTLVLLTSPRCPVCRYTQTPEPSGDNTCSSCDSKEVECRHYPVTLLSHVTLCYITLCYPVLLVLLCYPTLLCVTCITLLPHVTLCYSVTPHYSFTCVTQLPHVTLCNCVLHYAYQMQLSVHYLSIHVYVLSITLSVPYCDVTQYMLCLIHAVEDHFSSYSDTSD